jgi:predicted enzyme related to lactoylglutathione lyase
MTHAPLRLHGLRTVIYPAPDLAAAKAWWGGLLGFEPYFDEPFYVGFQVAGYELGLLPDGDPADGPVTYWGVEDLEAAVDAVIAYGGALRTPPQDVGDGIRTAVTRTPTGAPLGLIVNPHFSLD